MFLKAKAKFAIFCSFIFIILYFFAAAEPLKNDLYLFPLWSKYVSENDLETGISEKEIEIKNKSGSFKNQKKFPFIKGNVFGYFSENGEIFKLKSSEGKFSASSFLWTDYSKINDEKNIFTPDGSLITVIKAAGFAYMAEKRIYFFEPGGYSVSEYGTDGSRKWRYAHTAAITSFHSSDKAAVIGYSDGKLVCVDSAGKELFGFYPGGSAYQVIMGAAVSKDGTQVACVSGIDRQRVLLIKISSGQYKIVKHLYLEGNLHRQVFVDFNEIGSHAVFESSSGIGIIDCNKLKISFLNEKNSIESMGSSSENGIITILTKNNNFCKLLFVDPFSLKIAKTEFSAQNTFLIQEKNKIFFGSDNKISAIEMRGLK